MSLALALALIGLAGAAGFCGGVMYRSQDFKAHLSRELIKLRDELRSWLPK